MMKKISAMLVMISMLNSFANGGTPADTGQNLPRAEAKNGDHERKVISPGKAYKMSFIPGWSGSWNAEFTGKGRKRQNNRRSA